MQLSDYLLRENLSDSAFGRLAGLPRVTVRQYRLKQRTRPTHENLAKIVAATRGVVTADDFYGIEPQARRSRDRRAA
jgi:hypothetical protein